MNVHYLYNLHYVEPNRVAQKRAIIGHQNSRGNYRLYRHFLFHIQRKQTKTNHHNTNTNTVKRMSMCSFLHRKIKSHEF